MWPVEAFAEGVQRRRADVTVDDPERDQGQREQVPAARRLCLVRVGWGMDLYVAGRWSGHRDQMSAGLCGFWIIPELERLKGAGFIAGGAAA